MSINWFPGHMAVAVEKIKKAMADHDVVVEILDARCPMASANPLIESLRLHRQRPCLKVLNKVDAADPNITPQWVAYFNAQKNTHAIAHGFVFGVDALISNRHVVSGKRKHFGSQIFMYVL